MTRLPRAWSCLAAVVLMAQAARAAESVRVTADRVNLRSEPNTTSRVVTRVDKGAVLQVVGREGSWIKVNVPGTGATAYVSASLCEAIPSAAPAAPAAASTPAPAPAPAHATASRSGGSSRARDPLRFGPHLSWADQGLDFGIGARASTGIIGSPRLGALLVLDYFFGAGSSTDAAGVEVKPDGSSFKLGVYPTYSIDAGSVDVYGGVGLSYLHISVSASVLDTGETIEASSGSS